MGADLQRLFHPASVAIVGAIDQAAPPDKVLAPLRERFGDRFHIVDGSGGRVGEQPAHRRVAEIPGGVDVAILNVPPEQVVGAVEDCGAARAGFVIVTASELAIDERHLVDLVRRHGMRLIGPNGSINLYEAMPPAPGPSTGKIALITQSGHMGRLIFQSAPHGVAFSRWVPTGNESDLEASDFIEHFAADPDTAVIAGYFEGFRNGAALRRALGAAHAHGKPVVLLKVGRNQASSRMATTHSGHLTGSDAVIDGLFRQYGVIRVDDVDELIETAALCAKLPAPSGGGVALYGYAGGAVALMADVAEAHGISVPVLAESTQRRLHEVLPAHLGVANPVDNGNLYREGTADDRRRVFEAIAADPAVDVLVCASSGVIRGVTDDFIDDITAFAAVSPKPIVVTWSSWDTDAASYHRLIASGVPVFRSYRNCFKALGAVFERTRRSGVIGGRPPALDGPVATEPAGATTILDPVEAGRLLDRHGIPRALERMARSEDEVLAAAVEVGFPVVLKAALEGFPHRSDVGLVRVGLDSSQAVQEAFTLLASRARELAPSAGEPPAMIVQRQAVPGVEVIVGLTRDSVLGPALLVGMGGVLAEVHRDVSVRPLPVTPADVREMIEELRGYPLLQGVRGGAPADVESLGRILLAVAELASDPVRIHSLDLNPVIVGAQGAVAVDSLVEVELAGMASG